MRDDEADAEAEAWVLTTEAGSALARPRSAPSSCPGPADLTRWRKQASAEPGRRGGSGWPTADGVGRPSSRGPIAMWFEADRAGAGDGRDRRPAQGAPVRGRGLGRRPLLRDRRRRPGPGRGGRRSWPSTSTRGCAAAPAGTPRSTASPTGSPPIQARAERSRSPAGPGPHRPRPPRPGRRGARGPAATTRPGSDFLPSLARDRPRGGAIKLGPASDFDGHFAGDRIRGRTHQPRRRVQGGDRLVRRPRHLPPTGDPPARRRDLDRRDGPGRPAIAPTRTLSLGLRPRPRPGPVGPARRVRRPRTA